jgi:hypothetical protein
MRQMSSKGAGIDLQVDRISQASGLAILLTTDFAEISPTSGLGQCSVLGISAAC